MILLEGSDRVGKGTVAKALRSLLPNWSYRHHTKPPVDSYTYFSWFLADTHANVVVDRLHWSDYAYGHTYCGGMALTEHQWRLIELALMSRQTIVLHMTDDAAGIKSRWGKDEMYDVGPLNQLLDRYHSLAERCSTPYSRLPVVTAKLPQLVDLSSGEPTDSLRSIAQHAHATSIKTQSMLPPSLGIGSANPQFMVLGEAPCNQQFLGVECARLPLDFGPAAEFFWRALDELEIRWELGYYTNASVFSDERALATYVNRLSPSMLLCLGEVAHDLVCRAVKSSLLFHDVRVGAVHHPMYVKRFRHKQFGAWRDELGETLASYGNCEFPIPSSLAELEGDV